jgi:hypothetical protein
MASEKVQIPRAELEKDFPDVVEVLKVYAAAQDAFEKAKETARDAIGLRLRNARLNENKTWTFENTYEGLVITMWPTPKKAKEKAAPIKTVSFGRP